MSKSDGRKETTQQVTSQLHFKIPEIPLKIRRAEDKLIPFMAKYGAVHGT